MVSMTRNVDFRTCIYLRVAEDCQGSHFSEEVNMIAGHAALQDKADIVADIAQALVDIQEADVVVQLGNALILSGHIPEATQLASTRT